MNRENGQLIVIIIYLSLLFLFSFFVASSIINLREVGMPYKNFDEAQEAWDKELEYGHDADDSYYDEDEDEEYSKEAGEEE